MHVAPGGKIVSYKERINDIIMRHGKDSIVVKANILAKPRLEKIFFEFNSMLYK